MLSNYNLKAFIKDTPEVLILIFPDKEKAQRDVLKRKFKIEKAKCLAFPILLSKKIIA